MYHGIPAAGKTTRALAECPEAVRVNRDDIRTEVAGVRYHDGKPDKKVESTVTAIARERIIEALSAGRDVVCDDTNLNPSRVQPLLELAYLRFGAEVEHIMVDVPVAVAKQRNAERGRTGGREVPEYVIDQMAANAYGDDDHLRTFRSRVGHNKHGERVVLLWMDRDHSNPFEVQLAEFNDAIAPRPFASSEPVDAVVFDMDGTLVDVGTLVDKYMRGSKRNFHAFHTESEFSPSHDWVAEAARKCAAKGYAVLVVTARQATYVGATSRWLVNNHIPVDHLFMRGHDDFRPDYEAKRDIVADIEARGFRIVHAYDDNPQVLRLWHELGITTTTVPNPQWG